MKKYSTFINENKSNVYLNIEDYEIPQNIINSTDMLRFDENIIGIGIPRDDFKMMIFSNIEEIKDKLYLIGKDCDSPHSRKMSVLSLENNKVYNVDGYLKELKDNFLGKSLNFKGTKNFSGGLLYDFENVLTLNKIEFHRGNIWDYIKIFDNQNNWYEIEMNSDIILSDKIKKLENPIIDPYGEEDWGYEII